MSDENNENKFESALRVNEGVEQPFQVDENAVRLFKSKKKDLLSVDEYVKGVLNGNRTILSQAITLTESSLHAHKLLAQEIIERCLPYSGKSFRIGITGVPGVGKSTFIEAFGMFLTGKGHKLAVLAIDPSSSRSRGSILGDKTRMEELSSDMNAFIRPSPAAGSLGGVARKTRESIILCEAAGFDIIFIETVGVGQSETAVHAMVDFFLLLMLAGAGDELQGIKRGIMEMADAIVINKADGDNLLKAKTARIEYQNALHLFPPPVSGWNPEVETMSARLNIGMDRVWEIIERYRSLVSENGYFEVNRKRQVKLIMYEAIEGMMRDQFYNHPGVKGEIEQAEKDVEDRVISSYQAAQRLFDLYFSGGKGIKE
jgi:LAO/AO transport system kinase